MSTLLVSLSVLQFAFVAGFAVKRQKLIQATPSLVWFALITLPFIYQFQFFSNSPRTSQSFGLFMIATALAAGDILSIRNKGAGSVIEKSNLSHSITIYFLTFLVIFVPAFHYWLAGTIPIVDQYFSGASLAKVSQDRENFVKLLDVPYLLKVLFHWVSAIFGPIYFVFLFGFQPMGAALLVVCFLLIWRHRSNIQNLMNGTESRIGSKGSKKNAQAADEKGNV